MNSSDENVQYELCLKG